MGTPTVGPRALSKAVVMAVLLVAAMADCWVAESDPMRARQMAALRAFLEFDEAELSSHKILRQIRALGLEEDGYEIPAFTFWKKVRHWIYRMRYRVTDIFNANQIPLSYHLQKNPGMMLSEIIDLTNLD